MTRLAFLQDDIRIKAHFLICFLALVIYRYPLKETWKMPSAAKQSWINNEKHSEEK